MPTLLGRAVPEGVVHLAQRRIDGLFVWHLPLCWHADIANRLGSAAADDDEGWWLSVDHGALDPHQVLATTVPDRVTCPDCIEWMRA